MLFTVNVETNGPPVPTPTRNLTPGYGLKSNNFLLNKGKITYKYDLPQESETGREVIPGPEELEVLINLFPKCVNIVNVKSTKILQYKNFNWPGHVYINEPVFVQYTVVDVKPRLNCLDVKWQGEFKNVSGTTSCKIIIKQRIYT